MSLKKNNDAEGFEIDNDPPTKRQRLNQSSEGNNSLNFSSRVDDKNGKSETSGSQSHSGSSFGSPTILRRDCRYGSSCYRRNETHLMEYRHRLLEEAFSAMQAANDFSRLPSGFNLEDGDESAILEQAGILNEAGFQSDVKHRSEVSASGSVAKQSSPAKSLKSQSGVPITSDVTEVKDSFASSSSKKVMLPSPSTSKGLNDPIAKLFEERRNRMKFKQEVSKRIKSNIEVTTQVSQTHKTAVRNTDSMASKWEASCPYNYFLTKVREVPEEPKGIYSANFTDLFDPTLGEIRALCHINYMVEPSWLFDQTKEAGLEGKQTRIIYGTENTELEDGAKAFPWLKIFRAKSPFPYGHHHTKMSIVQYADKSVRFYVYTANLIESDWDNRTQGIWISPRCPQLAQVAPPPANVGESPTKFRADIIQYLSTYAVQATAAWVHIIKFIDCSSIRVFFVGSAPITSKSLLDGFQFGIKKMEKVLRSFEMDTEPNWPLTVQCSSIGTLGGSANDWLTSEFGSALSGKDRKLMGPINFVYPSTNNVKKSFDGVLGGGCLPYSAMTHIKQRWLDRHFCQWKADCSGRSRAPPHIKSYSRWSPDYSKMAWFLLTSANLSKAAWGSINKKGDRLSIMSWEAGILFIPEVIDSSSKYFAVAVQNENSSSIPRFPLHIDIPLVKYEKGDHPWFFETLQLAMSE